jgi:hypothetical protein
MFSASILTLIVTTILIAASDGPPTVAIDKTCRASTDELTRLFGDATMANFDSCMKQQSDALERLKVDWRTYPSSDRARCVQPTAYMPSYVEWLTCFEAEREIRRIRANETSAGERINR